MIHGKGDGMKLTFGSMKQIRQRYERVLGYRELQKKAIDDRAFLMRRRKNVREVFVASMVLVMFLVPVTLIGNYWGVFQISCPEMVGWITALILTMGSSMYGANVIIREFVSTILSGILGSCFRRINLSGLQNRNYGR